MLGLAILFGLLVWIVVTLITMTIGYKIAKKKGLFVGFMLTMGGWIVYWAIEFAYIQAKVSYLCKKEAGITVYVTPEQWRKQIGEEEWIKIKEFNDIERQSYPQEKITVKGTDYIPTMMINSHLINYSNTEYIDNIIRKRISIVWDYYNKNILLKYTYFSAGAGNWVTGGSPKFWLNNIQSCDDDIYQKFNNHIQSY